MEATLNGDYHDTFLTIYQNRFDVHAPSNNVRYWMDDFIGVSAGIDGLQLSSSASYYFVGTTYHNGIFVGDWSIQIGTTASPAGSTILTGRSAIAPEPDSAYLCLPFSLFALSTYLQQRKKQKKVV